MSTKRILLLTPEQAFKHHINPETKKSYPPAYTSEEVPIEYNPTLIERALCGYAQQGFDCSKEKTGIKNKKLHTMNCYECPYHPDNLRAVKSE